MSVFFTLSRNRGNYQILVQLWVIMYKLFSFRFRCGEFCGCMFFISILSEIIIEFTQCKYGQCHDHVDVIFILIDKL